MREESEKGTTILFSTHLMDQVSRLCSEVAILHRGRLAARGMIDELRAAVGVDATLEDVFVHFTSNGAVA
jgi:ABC-2 type transport system ATP-binding protein